MIDSFIDSAAGMAAMAMQSVGVYNEDLKEMCWCKKFRRSTAGRGGGMERITTAEEDKIATDLAAKGRLSITE